jgi:hypothetical protein
MTLLKKRVAYAITGLAAVTGITSPALAFADIICDPISQTCVVIVCEPVTVDLPDGTSQEIDVCSEAGDFPFPG